MNQPKKGDMRIVMETSPQGRIVLETFQDHRMTLTGKEIINRGNVFMDGNLNIGGSLNNSGRIDAKNKSIINVEKDVLNTGDITLGEVELKSLIIETVKTSGSAIEFALILLKKLGIEKFL